MFALPDATLPGRRQRYFFQGFILPEPEQAAVSALQRVCW